MCTPKEAIKNLLFTYELKCDRKEGDNSHGTCSTCLSMIDDLIELLPNIDVSLDCKIHSNTFSTTLPLTISGLSYEDLFALSILFRKFFVVTDMEFLKTRDIIHLHINLFFSEYPQAMDIDNSHEEFDMDKRPYIKRVVVCGDRDGLGPVAWGCTGGTDYWDGLNGPVGLVGLVGPVGPTGMTGPEDEDSN